MRIAIINPPHQSIGSRIPREMLPPLGLLAVGGPLIDDDHEVVLIDADIDDLPVAEIVSRTAALAPDAILIGHNGSTSAHPTVVALAPLLREKLPLALVVYGGVFPTYHWKEALDEIPDAVAVVRGEGEDTTVRLMRALEDGGPLDRINGIAYRRDGKPYATAPAQMIANLNAYRVGWELIDHARYSYYGGLRGVVIQFSRGCPHLCSFCGQRGFWTRWRHRDPVRFAKEIARLHHQHGIKLISLADENPTTSKKIWKAFLEALIAENLPDMTMIGTFRASDIVRDADILHLYRRAGFRRFLIGMETTDEATLEKVRKGSDTKTDREAIRLLRQHGILSLVSYVVGFEEETDRDYWRAFRQLLIYDPDQIVTLYVTPHRWTPFFREVKDRRVIQLDQRRWDYKHQVLASRHVPPWRTFATIKLIEILVQARPKALRRALWHPDPTARHGMRWYARMGRRVWLYGVACFVFRDRRVASGPSVSSFWGAPQDDQEESMAARRVTRPAAAPRAADAA